MKQSTVLRPKMTLSKNEAHSWVMKNMPIKVMFQITGIFVTLI